MANWQVDAQGNLVDVDALKPGYSWNPQNGQITYDDSWNKNPLTAVGYQTYDSAGNLGFVTKEQARQQAKTPYTVKNVEEGWAAAANDPQFWEKYSGIVVPQTATKSTTYWQNGQSSTVDNNDLLSGDGGGIFGSSFLDPKTMSTWVEPINKYVGPLVLPTVMAIGGGLVGGGLAGAATAGTALAGTTAGSAIAGAGAGAGSAAFNTIDQIDQGNVGGALLGLAGSTIMGGIGGAALGSGSGATNIGAGEIPIGSSLAEMEALYPQVYGSIAQEAGLNTVPNAASGLMYGSPEFYAAGGQLGLDPAQTASLVDTSLGGQSAMGLTNTPITYGSPEMQQQGSDLGLTNDQTMSLTDKSLGGVSANELATSKYKPLSDSVTKMAKGLLGGGGANQALPTFNVNFTPLSQQAFGTTGNNWMGTNSGKAAGAAGTGFSPSPFKGSFLANAGDDTRITDYLAEYLPLNASKKLKDFSSFVA